MKNKHTEKKPYSCDKCTFKTTTQELLSRHGGTGCSTYSCPHCHLKFSSKQELSRHDNDEHRHDAIVACVVTEGKSMRTVFRCKKCDFLSKSYGLSVKHAKLCCKTITKPPKCVPKRTPPSTTSSATPYRCPICLYYYRDSPSLSCHVETHVEDASYRCIKTNMFCARHVQREHSAARQHVLREHSATRTPSYRCTECEHVTGSLGELAVHLGQHPSGIFKTGMWSLLCDRQSGEDSLPEFRQTRNSDTNSIPTLLQY